MWMTKADSSMWQRPEAARHLWKPWPKRWDDVKVLVTILKEKYGVKEVFTYYVGAVIGSHAGPGTVALFFLGNKR